MSKLNLSAVRKLAYQEDPPVGRKEAAEMLGVSEHAYAAARNVVFLMDEELDADEWEVVAEAAALVSRIHPTKADELIAPIMYRHFGDQTNNAYHGGPPKARDAMTKAFLASVTKLTDTMNAAHQIQVPWLPTDERESIVEELRSATGEIEHLINAIQQGGTHNVGAD